MNVVDSCGWLEVFAGSSRSAMYAACQRGECAALVYVARMRATLVALRRVSDRGA